MLRFDAGDDELGRVRAALEALERVAPSLFERLFSPVTPRRAARRAAPSTAEERAALEALVDAGLLVREEGEGALYRGLHRVRREGQRLYVMELADGADEVPQEVWPETAAVLRAIADFPSSANLLDVGTGAGVLALEAAARGLRVVATDLFPRTVALAAYNARLNGVRIETAVGHLLEPVRGRRFDVVVSVPHYGRIHDALRLELFAGALDVLRPGGRMIVATQLEWDARGELGALAVLRPLAEAGADVEVAPIDPALDVRHRHWFFVPEPEPALPRLVGRGRFVVTITAPSEVGAVGGVCARLPAPEDTRRVVVVPLARVVASAAGGRRPMAAVASAEDVAALLRIAEALAAPEARWEGGLPSAILDACRFGARRCVPERPDGEGAAGAIVDGATGQVRPCTDGGAVASVAGGGATLAALRARYAELAAEAEARRGCATCAVAATCSRCLFPAAAALDGAGREDERAYCNLMRTHHEALAVLLRLLPTLDGRPGPFRLRRWPHAGARPLPEEADPLVREVQEAWLRRGAWLVEEEGAPEVLLAFVSPEGLQRLPVSHELAAFGAAIADGAPPPDAADDRASLYALSAIFA
jgi:SAM-dependent methyltransferase